MAGESKLVNKSNIVKDVLSGAVGGISNVISGYPLDTIKVTMQTMPETLPGHEPIYTGVCDCAKKIVKAEGIRGLFKGMVAPLTGVAPIFAINLSCYALCKRFLQEDIILAKPYYYVDGAAGAFAGLISSCIMTPVERVKCLLQTQKVMGVKRKYHGTIDCAMKVYKEGGIRSLYRGTCATLLRDIPANAVYYTTYEYIKYIIKTKTDTNEVSLWGSVFGGGIAGMTYWCIALPPDVLKSRLQSAPDGTYKHGIRSVFKELIAQGGPKALYRGAIPIMTRAFPANAACFFGIEMAQKLLTFVNI